MGGKHSRPRGRQEIQEQITRSVSDLEFWLPRSSSWLCSDTCLDQAQEVAGGSREGTFRGLHAGLDEDFEFGDREGIGNLPTGFGGVDCSVSGVCASPCQESLPDQEDHLSLDTADSVVPLLARREEHSEKGESAKLRQVLSNDFDGSPGLALKANVEHCAEEERRLTQLLDANSVDVWPSSSRSSSSHESVVPQEGSLVAWDEERKGSLIGYTVKDSLSDLIGTVIAENLTDPIATYKVFFGEDCEPTHNWCSKLDVVVVEACCSTNCRKVVDQPLVDSQGGSLPSVVGALSASRHQPLDDLLSEDTDDMPPLMDSFIISTCQKGFSGVTKAPSKEDRCQLHPHLDLADIPVPNLDYDDDLDARAGHLSMNDAAHAACTDLLPRENSISEQVTPRDIGDVIASDSGMLRPALVSLVTPRDDEDAMPPLISFSAPASPDRPVGTRSDEHPCAPARHHDEDGEDTADDDGMPPLMDSPTRIFGCSVGDDNASGSTGSSPLTFAFGEAQAYREEREEAQAFRGAAQCYEDPSSNCSDEDEDDDMPPLVAPAKQEALASGEDETDTDRSDETDTEFETSECCTTEDDEDDDVTSLAYACKKALSEKQLPTISEEPTSDVGS